MVIKIITAINDIILSTLLNKLPCELMHSSQSSQLTIQKNPFNKMTIQLWVSQTQNHMCLSDMKICMIHNAQLRLFVSHNLNFSA